MFSRSTFILIVDLHSVMAARYNTEDYIIAICFCNHADEGEMANHILYNSVTIERHLVAECCLCHVIHVSANNY